MVQTVQLVTAQLVQTFNPTSHMRHAIRHNYRLVHRILCSDSTSLTMKG